LPPAATAVSTKRQPVVYGMSVCHQPSTPVPRKFANAACSASPAGSSAPPSGDGLTADGDHPVRPHCGIALQNRQRRQLRSSKGSSRREVLLLHGISKLMHYDGFVPRVDRGASATSDRLVAW
jgi:hypothetical protein